MKRKIAILWHMHQPYYRNPFSGKLELPWVRLHGLKDYYGMVAILKDYPKIKATYNLVPSLLVQLECYLKGEKDLFQELFIKDAASLNAEEASLLVRHFFSANYRNLIKPYPRYRFLLEKKKQYSTMISHGGDWLKVFTVEEFRDLQVWYTLCHFDEIYKSDNHDARELIRKGQHFTESDKRKVMELELELLGKIIPEYKKFADTGQIEISTTPFYHPILPLLLDPQQGRRANPHLPEYDLNFHWKEDAIHQLESALTYMKNTFGRTPAGFWPSEGSLSQEVLEIMDNMGVKWTATDEDILSKSLGIPIIRNYDYIVQNSKVLYKPYVLADESNNRSSNIKVFFRDRHLSDLIGFHYRKMPYKTAAEDLINRIKRIPATDDTQLIIPIILDGENAWEYYDNAGRDFLGEFFQRVSEDDSLETVTFSEALDAEPGMIKNYSPGSWISGNFDIWIGDEEDRKGWKLLEKTHAAVDECKATLSPEKLEEVRTYLSIAEGSDWFWWFGKENYTEDLDIFDNLFRKNMQKVYQILGKEAPADFYHPIAALSQVKGANVDVLRPTAPLHPIIDGRQNSYFEWLYAGKLEASGLGSAMNISNPLANTLHYGFDDTHFYLRIDTDKPAAQYFNQDYSLALLIKKESTETLLPIQILSDETVVEEEKEVWVGSAAGRIIEIAIRLEPLQLKPGDAFQLQLEWKHHNRHFQAIPAHDYFHLTVPTIKDYAFTWQA